MILTIARGEDGSIIPWIAHPLKIGHYISECYHLRGVDESKIRALFTNNILSFCENETEVCIEANGDQIIFYREDKPIEPEEVESFLEEWSSFFKLFKNGMTP